MKYLKGKTIILNTHALYFLKYVDLIFVMDKGRIISNGNYETVMLEEKFKKLYEKVT